MTQANAVTVICPQCQSEQGVNMSDGNRLCFGCRHEWNPAAPQTSVLAPQSPAPALVPPPGDNVTTTRVTAPQGASTTVDDVLGPPAEVLADREAQAALDAMVGTQVVLDGGQLATIESFPDDDHVTVWIDHGEHDDERVTVDFNDVLRSVEAPPPVAEVDDQTAQGIAAVNMTIAGLALRAGLATIAGEYPNAELITPPTGWLPDDGDVMPAIEQGVAYGFAFLIHAYSIDREVIERMADMLISDSQAITDSMKGGE